MENERSRNTHPVNCLCEAQATRLDDPEIRTASKASAGFDANLQDVASKMSCFGINPTSGVRLTTQMPDPELRAFEIGSR